MLNPVVVRQDHAAARAIAEQPDDSRVGAVQNTHDPALSAFAVRTGSYAAKFNLHVVAVHRVANRVARNKYVAVQLRHRRVWHHKAIAVLMENQPPGDPS